MAKTRKLTVEILGDAKGAMGAFGQVNRGASSLGQSFVAFGKQATLAFAAVSAGAIVIGRDLVNAASNLQESISKTNVVFGDAAAAVLAFSKTAAGAIGQSQRQALEAAGTFGIFGKAAGLTGSDLSKFSIDLTTLASDMASFSNTTPQEAIEALGAALRGESEPIRRYGVLLNDAALKAKAMELGIYSGNGTLTAQQKILAATALIFEQTTDAQGDFIRTQGGVANQTKILTARFEDAKATLGTALLPVALKVIEALNWMIDVIKPLAEKYLPKIRDMFAEWYAKIKPVLRSLKEDLEPVLQRIGDWMKNNTGTVKVFFGVLAGAAVLAAIVALGAAIASLFNPIVLVIAGIALLVAAFKYAYDNFEWFRTAIDAYVSFVRDKYLPALVAIFNFLKLQIERFIGVVQTLWSVFGGTISSYVQRMWDGIKTVWENALQTLKGVFDFYVGLFTGDWGRMWDGFKSTWSGVIGWIGGAVQMLIAPVQAAIGLIGDALGIAFEGMKTAVGAAVDWAKEKFISGFSIISNAVRTIFNGITNTIKSVLQGAINFFVDAINKVIGAINTAIRAYNSIPIAPDIGTIPPVPRVRLAQGGIVTRPTYALIGEAGPEAVVPLTSPYAPDFLQSGGGGGDTYITIKVDAGLVSSPEQTGQLIIDAIRRAERRSGKVFAAA